MKRVEIRADAFPPVEIDAMRASLIASPLLGPSVLAGGFAATRGFAVVFRRDGVDRLKRLVPGVAPFLAALLGLTSASAFYLNLLVVHRGAGVAAHEDGTLTTFCGLARAPPERVSVTHEVAAVGAGTRMSLVLEQYALAPHHLAQVPRCHFASEDHFARVLEAARPASRPPPCRRSPRR